MSLPIILDAPPRRRDWRGVALTLVTLLWLASTAAALRLAFPAPAPAEGPYRTAEACVQAAKKVKR